MKETKFEFTNSQPPPKKKCPDPHDCTGKFNQTFREELISILQNIFQKIEEKGMFSKNWKSKKYSL